MEEWRLEALGHNYKCSNYPLVQISCKRHSWLKNVPIILKALMQYCYSPAKIEANLYASTRKCYCLCSAEARGIHERGSSGCFKLQRSRKKYIVEPYNAWFDWIILSCVLHNFHCSTYFKSIWVTQIVRTSGRLNPTMSMLSQKLRRCRSAQTGPNLVLWRAHVHTNNSIALFWFSSWCSFASHDNCLFTWTL